jgi:hypothetical protein
MRKTLITMLTAISIVGCVSHPKQTGPETVLAQMRADTAWIRTLDSLAAIAIGPGVKCIDPVWHLFSWEGRNFFHNQDWGGVLEIPEGFLPEDDLWQAVVSFHGTRAWSPDSLILISFYAGFNVMEEDVDENDVRVERNLNEDGIVFYGRTIPKGPYGVEYSVSLQYPEGMEDRVADIIPMIDRYPYGPDGKLHPGEAVL